MQEKKYLINNEKLMAEWDYDKNNELGLNPNIITYGSGKKAFWKCNQGHSWQTSVYGRTSGSSCPICSYKNRGETIRLSKNKNKKSFAEKYPNLLKEWDYEKNGNLNPKQFTSNSNCYIWWKCKNNHSWKTKINSRISGNTGCPYCSNQKVMEGFNDLESQNFHFINEWNYEKNKIKLNQIYFGSTKKVWWKCSICSFEWQSTIRHRINGTGCPRCAKNMQTSFPEQAIFYYIKKIFKDSINGFKNNQLGISEIDIFIPSLHLGIEYDGSFYHKSSKNKIKDKAKYDNLKNNNILLIRVIEKGRYEIEVRNDCDYSIIHEYQLEYKNLKKVIFEIFEFISKTFNIDIKIDIDIERDLYSIQSQFSQYIIRKSLKNLYPDIANEWHPTKNGMIKPENVYAKSAKKYWFICKNGHEYKSILSDRTCNKSGCPYCSTSQPIKINQYSREGVFIKQHNSLNDAAKAVGLVSGSSIRSAINNCGLAKNFQFRIANDSNNDINAYKGRNIKNKKKVVQYSLIGKKIKSYNSISEAKRLTGISKISDVCLNKRKSAGGYIWKFEE